MRQNNKFKVRGRFTRDPNTSDNKSKPGAKYCFGRIAVDQPFINATGDTQTSTTYVEVKVFDDTLAQVLIGGGAKQGTLIEATGAARVEVEDYEKDGKTQTSYKLCCVLDNAEFHTVVIEAQPKGQDS